MAKMGLNWLNLGQNTRYFDIPVELSVISEISVWKKSLFCESGYFDIYGIFVRPLDKKVHNQERPFNFESFFGIFGISKFLPYFCCIFYHKKSRKKILRDYWCRNFEIPNIPKNAQKYSGSKIYNFWIYFI